jgi:hypothetical protein
MCCAGCNRITASTAFSAFQWLQLKSDSTDMIKCCLTYHTVTSRASPTTNGDWQVEIRNQLVSKLAAIQKKDW